MMVRGRLAVGAILAAAAATSPALAAPAAKTSVDRFAIGFNARVEHETNMTGVSEAEARSRGISPDDTIYTPSVNVALNLPLGRQLFYLDGYAGYVYHDKNTIYDSERLTLSTGLKGRFGPCQTEISGNYAHALSSFDDIVLGPTIDNILETKGAKLQATCARPTGLGVTGSVAYEVAENDQSLLKPQDYEQTSYLGGIVYTRPRLGSITVFGQHTRTEYNHRLPLAGQTDGYEANTEGVTYERQLGARIQGTVTVSYSSVDGLGGTGVTNSDFSGLTYSLAGSYRASSRLRFDTAFAREVTPSNRFGNSYDVGTRYSLKGTYDLGSRISTTLGFEQRDVDSKGAPVFAGNLTNSKIKIVSGGVTYRMNRRINLSLDAAHEQRDANDPRFEYDNTRVGLSAGVTY